MQGQKRFATLFRVIKAQNKKNKYRAFESPDKLNKSGCKNKDNVETD